jgi:glycosyltransferase involved in cell wall biosynthesis
MAVGLPIVTTDNGGISELVEDGVCGTVVPARTDPEVTRGLADAFAALAADPARRAAYGEAAAERARLHFSPTAMARATTAAYREVLSAR